MELYHNQVTRVEGPFSLRIFHRSWGLMFLQANIEAPCTLLDFPTLDRFVEEIRENRYDVVGISSITTNVLKVRQMCELVRRYLPSATLVVGGHVASIADLEDRIDADHIVRGEGIRWLRAFLGEDPDRPILHPEIPTRVATRNMGIRVRERLGAASVTLVPSVGCPIGCNFCATSAMFGGKGNAVHFYETGEELFSVMCRLERRLKARSFFVMDENFLLHRKRALRLLELMERHEKPWSLYIFSSVNALRPYTPDELVRMGISWVWMGLEGEGSPYSKLRGTDTFSLVRELQEHGIRVLGSTIIGLDHHTPENIDGVIDYAVQHHTDFHQFMLYHGIPGTPFYKELSAAGRLRDETECPIPDAHGQFVFNYRHARIPQGRETELLLRAFERDFEVNGPSIFRVVSTTLHGWRRYKDHRERRIRERFAFDAQGLGTIFSAATAAARDYYRESPVLRARTDALLGALHREFRWKSRLFASLGGPYVLRKIRGEERRLAHGWTYEPPTFYERNRAAEALASGKGPSAGRCRSVSPQPIT
jgi:hypothetical protein